MPILDIELVVRLDEKLPKGLAAGIADRAAAIFGSAPGRTWVRLRPLPIEQYAEDGGGPPPDVYPVFVAVLHRRRPAGDELRREVALLTAAVAEVCNRPVENVHLLYRQDGLNRAAFGGQLVE